LSRLALDRGGPRDLAALRDGLAQAAVIADRLPAAELPADPASRRGPIAWDTRPCATCSTPRWSPNRPAQARDGGFIAPGYDADLDAARTLRDEGRGVIAGMQADYAAETGVQSLKIKHNNVLGYFIETTATHAQKMLSPPLSERDASSIARPPPTRCGSPRRPVELETRILNAGNRALEIEMALFRSLRDAVLAECGRIG
jgi:DNA mismatch repair protein MutS